MRFMMLMIPLCYETAPPDVQLDPERVKAMMKYNEALQEAGVLIALDGLHPTVKGARVKYGSGKGSVSRGPFALSGDLVAGFWLINTKSLDEAIEWMQRAPFGNGDEIEIRQVFAAEDFGEALTPDLREQEQRLRTQAAKR